MTQTENAVLEVDEPGRRVWTVTRRTVCTSLIHDSLRAAKVDGCCCPRALALTAAYEKKRRCGLIPKDTNATGTMRRLQALAVDGWPAPAIAERVGLHDVTISEIRRGMKGTVYGATAKKVKRVYTELAGHVGPSERTRRYAAKHGWLPYTAWQNIDDPNEQPGSSSPVRVASRFGERHDIDEIAVERAVAGDPPDAMTRAERREAVRVMYGQGLSYSDMAERLRTHTRMVHRDLTVLGLIDTSAVPTASSTEQAEAV